MMKVERANRFHCDGCHMMVEEAVLTYSGLYLCADCYTEYNRGDGHDQPSADDVTGPRESGLVVGPRGW